MLEQAKPMTASLNPSAHNEPSNCQVIKLRHYWNGPPKVVQGGGQLPHCYQGFTLHCAPVRVDLQDVNKVDLRITILKLWNCTYSIH